jgi:hypothetical protein
MISTYSEVIGVEYYTTKIIGGFKPMDLFARKIEAIMIGGVILFH